MLISHRLTRMIFRTCNNLATALGEKYFSLSASHYWISPICRATSSCSFSYTYRVTVSPSTLSRGSSIRAEARLPEISICAGVVTVCLIWHGAAYVRNKSSRVQCRCPHRKPIVYADLTRVVYSSRFRERYLILAQVDSHLIYLFLVDQKHVFQYARKSIIHSYLILRFKSTDVTYRAFLPLC